MVLLLVHCVEPIFDDKAKDTKALAVSDTAQNIISKNVCDVGGVVRWHLACTSNDCLRCHLAEYVGKVIMPGC